MLVILSGLPGVGKTTIARQLAIAMPAVHVRIDSIEQALRDEGVDVQGQGYGAGYAIAEDNLRLGHHVIADCVNPWPLTRAAWQAVADRAEVKAARVEVVCSNVGEHQRRVASRTPDIARHKLPTWTEVIERDYHPWTGDRLIVDTAVVSVDEAVRRILSAASPR
jgi:predicted kinase